MGAGTTDGPSERGKEAPRRVYRLGYVERECWTLFDRGVKGSGKYRGVGRKKWKRYCE